MSSIRRIPGWQAQAVREYVRRHENDTYEALNTDALRHHGEVVVLREELVKLSRDKRRLRYALEALLSDPENLALGRAYYLRVLGETE